MPATLDLTPDQLLTTTRAVRKRLDFERPVERSLVEECIDLALQAPTGSNRQTWHWVVVEDPDMRRAVAQEYSIGFDLYRNMPPTEYPEGDTRGERQDAVRSSAIYLSEHMHEAPFLVIPCADGRPPADGGSAMQSGFWGSLFPAVWSFQLALRSRGLGTALTTLHLLREREVADLLGIPFDAVTQAALLPVAYTKGTDFKPAPRQPLADVVHWGRW